MWHGHCFSVMAGAGAAQHVQPLAGFGGDLHDGIALPRHVPAQMQPVVRARAGRLDNAPLRQLDQTQRIK